MEEKERYELKIYAGFYGRLNAILKKYGGD